MLAAPYVLIQVLYDVFSIVHHTYYIQDITSNIDTICAMLKAHYHGLKLVSDTCRHRIQSSDNTISYVHRA